MIQTKPDELELMRHMLAFKPHQANGANGVQMHAKRKNFILLKWNDRGWWEYGSAVDGGWLTPKGYDAIREVLQPVAMGVG